MGFNISGLIINKPLSKEKIENLLDLDLDFSEEVDFDEATSSFKDGDVLDVYESDKGTFIITDLGNIYDIADYDGEIIQFIISDVSGTYYFEKYVSGKLERKLILSEGEVMEEFGDGIVTSDEDFMDVVWGLADKYVAENISTFKRYDAFSR